MPSFIVAEPQSADKKKVMKKSELVEMVEKSAEKKMKKEKKSIKKSKVTSEPDPDVSNAASPVKIKKEKKRKALEIDDEEEKSDTSSEMGEPMNSTSKKKKKMKVDDENEEVEKVDDPNAVSNFRISAPLRETLKARGIEALFPIQAMTFDIILDGSDLIGRARTGQVRVLSLLLPITIELYSLMLTFTFIFTND